MSHGPSPTSSSPTPAVPRDASRISPAKQTLNSTYTYPFAPSPDIIRASQKDAYFTGQILSQLVDLTRSVYGARFAQTHTTQLKVLSDVLYLGLTTAVGNRTLGEEYCDVVGVEVGGGKDGMGRLPGWKRRVGYVGVSVLGGWMAGLWVAALRRWVQRNLEAVIARRRERERARADGKDKAKIHTTTTTATRLTRILEYLLTNIPALTSPSPLHALSLTAFYFTGTYYTLPRRLFRLRYTLTRSLSPAEAAQRAGYEVLGVLLLCQLALQAYLHARETVGSKTPPVPANAAEMAGTVVQAGPGVEIGVGGLSLDANAFAPNTSLLFESDGGAQAQTHMKTHAQTQMASGAPTAAQLTLARLTRTPIARSPRIDLSAPAPSSTTTRSQTISQSPQHPLTSTSTSTSAAAKPDQGEREREPLSWLQSEQSRTCTLCLEPMRDPAATTCGHLFCWACIQGWVAERAECPLCRQECRAQHVLVLRG